VVTDPLARKTADIPELTQVLLSIIVNRHICYNWGNTVAIDELLRKQSVFTPDEVAMLGNVFENVLQTLGMVDRKDPIAEGVAKCLVEYAKTGICDSERLKQLTLQGVSVRQPGSMATREQMQK
jgi:hypothetical protein